MILPPLHLVGSSPSPSQTPTASLRPRVRSALKEKSTLDERVHGLEKDLAEKSAAATKARHNDARGLPATKVLE